MTDKTVYNPGYFDCPTIESAKEIILNEEVGLSPDERWDKETAWVRPMLSFPQGLILDYGCGIGRLASVLARPVLGADISPTMRQHAHKYVAREDFAAISVLMLDSLIENGLRFDGGIAAWVLQHCLDPADDIARLARGLRQGASLFVLNRWNRAVPATKGTGDDIAKGFASDEVDVFALLETYFAMESSVEVPATLCVPGAYARRYRRL